MLSPLGFELKVGRVSHFTVDDNILEAFIKRVYGITDWNFSLVAMEEWHNDSEHEFSVSREPLDKWQAQDLDDLMFNNGSANYMLSVLFQDMCNNGHIEEGEYLVRVCW